MKDSLRVPPQNLDAERCVIGSLLFRNDTIDEIDLKPAEHYAPAHQTMHAAIREMWHSGCRAIDAVTLAEELSRRDKLEDVGGVAYIGEVCDAVPHAAHVRYYSNIVRKKAEQRSLIYACTEAMKDAYDDASDDVLAELEAKLLNIRESTSSGEIVTMADAVDALEELERNPAAVRSTGLADVDRYIRGGLRGNQFIIIGGRPGSGKSILQGQIAKSFAERGEPSLIISLEMDRAEIAERYDKSVDRRTLRGLPIYLVDSVCEVDRIAGLIRLAKRKHGIQLAALDYLQLAESSDTKASRERQVAEVSRMCKRLAMELKIPVIAACQLNRASDKENRPPRLSDLRESGSIEQDADIVLLLHRDEDDNAKLIIGKQRNGSTGIVPLAFRPAVFRFENHSPDVGRL